MGETRSKGRAIIKRKGLIRRTGLNASVKNILLFPKGRETEFHLGEILLGVGFRKHATGRKSIGSLAAMARPSRYHRKQVLDLFLMGLIGSWKLLFFHRRGRRAALLGDS